MNELLVTFAAGSGELQYISAIESLRQAGAERLLLLLRDTQLSEDEDTQRQSLARFVLKHWNTYLRDQNLSILQINELFRQLSAFG
jgi:hypothetical protein